jgi:methyl-accepting chemotaxis protein
MNMTVKNQLDTMASIAIIAVLLLSAIGFLNNKNGSIGSANYNKIIYANELTADILPPPMYLVELMLEVEQLGEADNATDQLLVAAIQTLIADYQTRQERWLSSDDLDATLNDYIREDLTHNTQRLIDLVQNQILPTVSQGDTRQLGELKVQVRRLFTAHKTHIDTLVEMANSYALIQSERGTTIVSWYQRLFYLLVVLAIVAVVISSLFFSRKILATLGGEPTELMRISHEIANGHADVAIPHPIGESSLLAAISRMTDYVRSSEAALDKIGQVDAINRAQAVIEFNMDGTILMANDNFLDTLGYTLDEIQGKHHSIFVSSTEKASDAYRQFWAALNRGEYISDEFKRISKGGKEVWILASYNPIFNKAGQAYKVVKYATEVTQQKLQTADYEGQIAAIGKSQAVIEFDMNGNIQHANEMFLAAVGYSLEEVMGKHHSLFVDAEYRQSEEYRKFWSQLNDGVFASDEFKRIKKNGESLWLQASYNPILDLNNKPFKVVKYATNITGRKNAISAIQAVLMRLTKGDLSGYIEEELEGEYKTLGDAINDFIRELADTIGNINVAVTTISTAATEIAQGNADLSSRTEQQASSLEETASSMEELTGTVRLNSDNANDANSLASKASVLAQEGGGLNDRVVVTMASINDSARKISDIIGVIDGIAFQTNILALNAAVEAARAGEQGRGFAVVAAEVRNLAQRSADAAKDIKALISDSVAKIDTGNVLVNQSGETMKNVVTSIKQVNDLMAEIASASAQQSTGVDEVSKAVNQMDEVTQQNAALVEEAAAAAESLQAQAEQLAMQVSTFKLS